MEFLLLSKAASLGRMILPLSPGLNPTLGALGRMSSPVFSFTLVCHSGCLGPHEFTVYTCFRQFYFHTCLALSVPGAA